MLAEKKAIKPGKISKLSICAKIDRDFEVEVIGADFNVVKVYEDFVPDIFPGTCGGRYLSLEIDYETGKVTDWEKVKERLWGDI